GDGHRAMIGRWYHGVNDRCKETVRINRAKRTPRGLMNRTFGAGWGRRWWRAYRGHGVAPSVAVRRSGGEGGVPPFAPVWPVEVDCVPEALVALVVEEDHLGVVGEFAPAELE